MLDRHNEFVRQENLRDFRRKLEAETDPEKRKLLEQLLSEEKEKRMSRLGKSRPEP